MGQAHDWYWIRIAIGNQAIGKTAPLYKEIISLAKSKGVFGVGAIECNDGYTTTGFHGTSQLFGGQQKSMGLIFEIPIEERLKDDFVKEVKKLVESSNNVAMISASKADVILAGIKENE